jgi:hypothetical protein
MDRWVVVRAVARSPPLVTKLAGARMSAFGQAKASPADRFLPFWPQQGRLARHRTAEEFHALADPQRSSREAARAGSGSRSYSEIFDACCSST